MLKDELETLLETQKKEWSLLATNYDALSKVERKFFDFGGFVVRVEHNPARAVSSLAKTDTATIAQRKCFLCEANRPKEQEGIEFLGKYHALTNPFPIFPKHFTIADKPQSARHKRRQTARYAGTFGRNGRIRHILQRTARRRIRTRPFPLPGRKRQLSATARTLAMRHHRERIIYQWHPKRNHRLG